MSYLSLAKILTSNEGERSLKRKAAIKTFPQDLTRPMEEAKSTGKKVDRPVVARGTKSEGALKKEKVDWARTSCSSLVNGV